MCHHEQCFPQFHDDLSFATNTNAGFSAAGEENAATAMFAAGNAGANEERGAADGPVGPALTAEEAEQAAEEVSRQYWQRILR